MNQPKPNEAKQYRNALIAAIQNQQRVTEHLAAQNSILRSAVRDLVTAAGVQHNPRFASLMATAADETPDMTTEQAKQPDAKDDPTSEGAVPASANTGVTPAAVTDVQNSNVAVPVVNPLDNLQDVTAPTPGTDSVDPNATFNGDVRVSAPSNATMDPAVPNAGTTGRTSARQAEDEQERFVASLRLARLQISAGLASGEDLTVAQAIHSSQTPVTEINAVAQTLAAVAVRQAPVRDDAHRHLVPQAAPQQVTARRTPSLQGGTGIVAHATTMDPAAGSDEWAFGDGGYDA